jgi:hypothetical protein
MVGLETISIDLRRADALCALDALTARFLAILRPDDKSCQRAVPRVVSAGSQT